jgi:hypothetical protein
MMHWEKSGSFVCWSEMESLREMMYFFMMEMHLVKNSLANVAEPTGCPRRQNPWVSSTGIAGAVVSVGWGVVKNVAIVLAINRPSSGLEAEMRGSGDVPLQEVRILVFVVFTKQPMAAPLVLSVLQKNSRSGR